jgi:hypothetical protein
MEHGANTDFWMGRGNKLLKQFMVCEGAGFLQLRLGVNEKFLASVEALV